jgi:MFS family permease
MGWLQTIGFLTVGLLVEVFVWGLLFSIRGERGFGFGISLLVCFGFGLLLIGAFRTDPIGGQHTIEGMIHSITSRAVFLIFPIASLLIAHSLRKDSRWRGLFVYTIAMSGLALALVIGWLCLSDELSWFGLYERILVANAVVWVVIMAIRLLRLSLSAGEKPSKSLIS